MEIGLVGLITFVVASMPPDEVVYHDIERVTRKTIRGWLWTKELKLKEGSNGVNEGIGGNIHKSVAALSETVEQMKMNHYKIAKKHVNTKAQLQKTKAKLKASEEEVCILKET